MKIAYIISAYKNPAQLVRLIDRLDTPTSSFFLHVDKKTGNDIYQQIVKQVSRYPNVHFLSRHTCHWGNFGHVSATTKGIDAIFNQKISFDYAILLTGQDYPIKSNIQIANFLQRHKGYSFMEYFPLPHVRWRNGGIDRLQKWHFHFFNRHYSLSAPNCLGLPGFRFFPFRRELPENIQPFGGSSYWCLSRECLTYVHQFIKNNPAFMRFFKWVHIPDESFFQTIVLNSPLKDTVINDDLRYIKWPSEHSRSPNILQSEDFKDFIGSPKLFARKFDATSSKSAEVLDQIDKAIIDMTS